MQWIDNLKEQPDKPGKYIVRTKTQMGNNRFDCEWTGKHWSCNNQIVTEWLKEN